MKMDKDPNYNNNFFQTKNENLQKIKENSKVNFFQIFY